MVETEPAWGPVPDWTGLIFSSLVETTLPPSTHDSVKWLNGDPFFVVLSLDMFVAFDVGYTKLPFVAVAFSAELSLQ